MDQTAAISIDNEQQGLSRRGVLLLWLGALLVILAGLGEPVVQRTQEARVLETGREMLDADARGRLIPRLNTELRLQKPPLAYWTAAGMFQLFGVSEWAGRLPFAIAGWLTIGIVYQIGRLLFDRGIALMAGLVMGSGFFYFRFARLAETDVLASLFVTGAVWLIILGKREERGRRWVLWFQLAGLCVGLAALAKGLPAVFPLIFAVVWAAIERDKRLIMRLGASGGLVTALVVGGWWFLYLRLQPEWAEVKNYLAVTTGGEDHPGPWYSYIPQMLAGVAPWAGFGVLAVLWIGGRFWEKWRERKRFKANPDQLAAPEELAKSRWDSGLRALVIWASVIFLPLCVIGNKQFHYLVPMAGPAALMIAYAIEWGGRNSGDPRAKRGLVIVFIGTLICCAIAAPGLVYAARKQREFLMTIDLLLAALVVLAGVATVLMWRKRGLLPAIRVFAVGTAIVMGGVFAWWYPSLNVVTHRTFAADLRREFGDGPYVIYGRGNVSYPLIFNLRSVAPRATTPAELEAVLARAPRTVVIAQTKNKVAPPPIPEGLTERVKAEIGDEGMAIRAYGAAISVSRPPRSP